MADRELVRCGCGEVRNDQDPPVPLALVGDLVFLHYGAQIPALERPAKLEPPRACRGCGSVYMLPKPSAPTEPR